MPWDHLQWHGIGMQSGRKELDRIWTELIARDPHLYVGFEIVWSGMDETERPAHEILAAYFGDSAVADSLVEAADKWLDGSRPHPRALDAMHLFGAAFYFGGYLTRAQSLLAGPGRRMPENLPWAALSVMPARGYAQVRRDLGLS